MGSLRNNAAAIAGTLYCICGQDAPAAETPVVGPDSVQLIGITLTAVAGRPHMAVGVGNRSKRVLWLRITVDAGKPVHCEGERVLLPAMKIEWYLCPVDPIVEGRAYPVSVEVFGDEWDEQPGGVKSARPVFTMRDIQQLQPKLRP